MDLSDLTAPLSERRFRYQFLATACSVVGDSIVPVALAFAVLDLTGSAGDLGIVLAARTVMLVVFFLAGGVWADRLPRQRLMMISDVGRAATQAAMAILLISGNAELVHFVVLQAINGAASAFFEPAQIGLTPNTVSRPRLQQANALLSLVRSGASIGGPALAGIIVATAGSGWALAVDALTFVLSAIFLTRIDLPKSAQKVERTTFFADLAAGWSEVRSRSWVWISITNFAVFQLLALPAFFVLGPFVADRSLGGASAWASILVAAGVGAIAGDVLAMKMQPERPLRSAFLTMLLAAPVLVLLGIEAPRGLVAGAAFLWGISMTFFVTVWLTVLQEHVPDESISRVSSYDWLGSTALRPIGLALAGPVAEAVGVGRTLVAAACVIVVVEILTAFVPAIASLPRSPVEALPASGPGAT